MTGPASSDPTPSDPASDPLAAPPTPREKATTGSAELRAAARDLVDVGILIHEAAAHATTALTDKAVLAAIPRSLVAGCLTQRALLKTVTNRDGLGYAVTGNRLATLAAKAGAMAGAESLAVRVLATSLRLRIAAVALDHPELVTDPMLGRLVQAAAEDRDLEAVRALRALLKDRGAVRTLSALAPVFGEVLALRALLDENPLNDAAAWLIATGRGYATADPITGMSNRAVAVLDRGEGAARRVESGVPLNDHGSLLAFLGNISALGTKGRVLVQSVEGPDGVVRHVVQAPGMRAGTPDNHSPQDLLGAFSSAVLDSSPYSRALTKAVEDYGVPVGDEIALIGHSAGGAAIMNLAQDPGFCARHTVTHAVAVGSPIDFKKPADPRTWVASVTNQHDIIPTLDGQGAGGCFDLHPDWYVVDYFDATHLFPLCHSIEHYMANLADDLPEARQAIDERLGPYRGRVVRSQAYLLSDRVPYAEGLPFQTHGEGTAAPPVRCREGSALTAYFAADAVTAAELLRGSGLGPAAGFGGRALVALHVAWNRRTSVGAYRELHLGVLLRSADRGRSGWFTVASVVDGADVCAVAARLWGGVPYELPMEVGLTGRAVNVSAGELLRLRGSLGPWLPRGDRGLVGYARDGDTVLRSRVHARGKGRAHLAPMLRLGVALRAHPLADAFRRLDLDGARPLLCLTSHARQTLTDAAVPVLIT